MSTVIDDAIERHRPAASQGTIAGFLDTLDPPDRAKLDAILQDPEWTYEAVGEVLKEVSDGRVGSASSVRRYRRSQWPEVWSPRESR